MLNTAKNLVTGIVSTLTSPLRDTKPSRTEAARKAVATRKANARKRSATAQKAAATRKANAAKRQATAKRGAQTRRKNTTARKSRVEAMVKSTRSK